MPSKLKEYRVFVSIERYDRSTDTYEIVREEELLLATPESSDDPRNAAEDLVDWITKNS